MNIAELTDLKGNTLSFARLIPSMGYQIVLTAKDGKAVSFDLIGENLSTVAEALGSAAAFSDKFGR